MMREYRSYPIRPPALKGFQALVFPYSYVQARMLFWILTTFYSIFDLKVNGPIIIKNGMYLSSNNFISVTY